MQDRKSDISKLLAERERLYGFLANLYEAMETDSAGWPMIRKAVLDVIERKR